MRLRCFDPSVAKGASGVFLSGQGHEIMAVKPIKVLLFFAGGCTAAVATAYVSDVFDPYLAPPAQSVSIPAPADPSADPKFVRQPGKAPAVAPPTRSEAIAADAELPSFDLVRVEGDGSIVVAGRAAPNTKVEIDTASQIIGSAVAGPEGDFVIVIDHALKSGGYQLVLRSTTSGNEVATSRETAVVSIPAVKTGQVLVLIEEPGKPSRLITVPQTAPSGPAGASVQANAEVAASPAAPSTAAPGGEPKVTVEAVEIEGRRVFVAGAADPGRKVRAYANAIMLGEDEASPEGRFLIEAERDLPTGNYIFRVDVLARDGLKVIARASVPFEREAGEAIAAVAQSGRWETPQDVAAAFKTTAPKLEKADSAVIIRRGDTLWRISRRVYGLGIRYSAIYLANQAQITDPDRIWPGQVFRLPEKTPEGESADLTTIGRQATSKF